MHGATMFGRVIRLILAALLALAFIPIFGTAVLLKSVSGFLFDSDAIVRVAREVNLYGDLSGLFNQMVRQPLKIAPDAPEGERKLAEGFWTVGLNKALHEGISESFFYDLTGKWHQGFVSLATGGTDATWVDFSGLKSKVHDHVERFGAEQKAEALQLSPESITRVAGWQKSLKDATDRIPDQCTLSQIIEAGGRDSRKAQGALEPVRRNVERLHFFEKVLLWAALSLLGAMALILIGSLRRISVVLGVSLFAAGVAYHYTAERMADFFLGKARVEALALAQGTPSHAKERMLEITGTVFKRATHHADDWVYGGLAIGAVLAGVGISSAVFLSRAPAAAQP